jgi:hypothetical protein
VHEQAKIDEAQYFLTQLPRLVNQRKAFNYTLSAFLSAARSALQYAHKEASAKPGGRAWYDAELSGKAVIKFFKDQRDIGIHESPIKPSANIQGLITEGVRVSDSCSATIVREDGTVETHDAAEAVVSSPRANQRTAPEMVPSAEYEYSFRDWSGSEDVIMLCEMYLDQVRGVVRDGAAKRFLTP